MRKTRIDLWHPHLLPNTAPLRRLPNGHDVFDVHAPGWDTARLLGNLRGLGLVLAKWRCLGPGY